MAVFKLTLADRWGSDNPDPEDVREAKRAAWTLCMEWFDGPRSAFWRLVDDKAVPMAAVLREIDLILASQTSVAVPYHERFRAFRALCERLVREDKARRTLADALKLAKAAGLEWREVRQSAERIFGGD